MKLVTAIIKPDKLSVLRKALSDIEVKGMTITEVRGFGRQKGQTTTDKGSKYTIEFLPKLKCEIAVTSDQLLLVIDTIIKTVGSDTVGDGKIFISNLEGAFRIRTGESGEEAV